METTLSVISECIDIVLHGFIDDQNDETRLVVKIDSAMGLVLLKVKMTPDYPHSVPELSVSGTSHRLVVGDAIKALEKEVILVASILSLSA